MSVPLGLIGAGKYKTTVVICMLTYEVDASRSRIYGSCSSVKMLDETTSYMFYIHTFYVLNE